MLILADSMAAIQAVKKTGKTGKARSEELDEGGAEEGEGQRQVCLGQSTRGHPRQRKSRSGSQTPNQGGRTGGPHRGGGQTTADGQEKAKRAQVSWGKGRVAGWSRRAATRYTHCRTGKGNLRGWLREIGKEDGEECRWCGEGYEYGEHIVFHCQILWRPEADRGQKWSTWEDLDDKRWVVLVEKQGDKEGEMEEWDLVEEFFNRIREPEKEEEDEDQDEG